VIKKWQATKGSKTRNLEENNHTQNRWQGKGERVKICRKNLEFDDI
jgi:hypothetical protein